MRRAIGFDFPGLSLMQPEASRRTQDRIIIIIEGREIPGIHSNFEPKYFEHYTREQVSMEGKVV
jgi:hypothetical protein